MLADVTFQPIMFVVLFAYVFGGSINAGVNYREWLLPGIMVQTMAFSCFIVAIGLTNDLNKGIVDRFRSLPISRSSVLIGRSIYSLIHSSIGVVVMSVTGLLIGWRIHNGFWDGVLGYALLLLFGFAMMWIGIVAGSALKSVEAVQGVMFTAIFPLTFLADTFAPAENMTPTGCAPSPNGTRSARSSGPCASCGATPRRWHPTRRCRCTIRSCRRSSGRLG